MYYLLYLFSKNFRLSFPYPENSKVIYFLQLNVNLIFWRANFLVEKTGIEPATLCLQSRRSPKLSYFPTSEFSLN